MKENRRYVRIIPPPENPVEIQVIGQGFIEVLSAKDISVGGACVAVPHGFAGCNLNQEVELVITLPEEVSFKAKGKIRHQQKTGSNSGYFGVEFAEIGPEGYYMIEKYIRNILIKNQEKG